MAFGMDAVNRAYYARNDGWCDFYAFNALRAQFTDYARFVDSPGTRRALAAAGWSRTDLAMIRNWNFADGERFSLTRLQTVLQALPQQDQTRQTRSPGQWLALLASDWELRPLLLIGGVCLILMGGGWWMRLVPLGSLALATVISLLLFRYFHLPERVSFPLFATFAVVAVAGSCGDVPWGQLWARSPRGMAWVCLLAGVTLLLLWCAWHHRLDSLRGRERQDMTADLVERLQPREGQLYVLWADAFPTEDLIAPLRRLSVPRTLKALDLGGSSQTPIGRHRLQQFGITDLYAALVERPNVFLASDEPGNRILGAYMAEHYGVRLGGRVVFSHPALGPTHLYALTDLNRPAHSSSIGR